MDLLLLLDFTSLEWQYLYDAKGFEKSVNVNKQQSTITHKA